MAVDVKLELQHEIIKFMNGVGLDYFQVETEPFRIFGFIFEKFMVVDLKDEAERISNEERIFLEMVNSNGSIAFVARSFDGFLKQISLHFQDKKELQVLIQEYFEADRWAH